MPFYTQRFRMSPIRGRIYLPELVKVDKGNGLVEVNIDTVDQCKELPPFEAFDLKTQLDQGVQLKQVNYKMIVMDEFPVDSLMEQGEDNNNKQEQTNKQEQINKQEQTNKGEN